MERQFKQSMTAPDWELEDYEWWGPLTCPLVCAGSILLHHLSCCSGAHWTLHG